jgi:RNA polymerase sigma-70 factor (ECF subfamily)
VDVRAVSVDGIAESSSVARHRAHDFVSIYQSWFDEVIRWLPAMGVPDAELEDVAQEVFIVVRRKLATFQDDNLPGWLYGITLRTASSHRRQAWFRNLFLRPRDVLLADIADRAPSPFALLERKEAQQTLARVLSRMSDKRRRAFVLYELEGYSGEEIAQLERIPLRTVWTRLHHARKDFVAFASRLREKDGVA